MKKNLKFLGFAAPVLAAASLSAADLKSPFESLPSETLAAFRFDNSPEMLDTYVEKTKIGKLLFSEEKVAEYKEFIQKLVDSEEAGGNFIQTLNEVGLELDDLYEMISSHIGGAIIDQEVPGHLTMPTVVLWAEMSDGIAERALNAVLDGSADEDGIERTDLELPGGPGARIRTIADGSSFLVSQLGNRFFFAIGQPRQAIESMEAAKAFEEAELEALGRFMAAQVGDGGDFLSSFYADGGVSSVRPNFESRLEILGDIQKLLDFVPAQTLQGLQAVDVDKLTKFGIWSGFVDMEERSVMFIGAPAPRKGLAKLMENESFDFSPPAWVPSSVNTYTSASFDMMKLYDFFLETAKKFMPPEQVEQQVQMGNMQLQMMLQSDIPTLLSSFGNRFHIVEYPIELVEIASPQGEMVEIPRSSQALVVDFSRPEILEAGLAQMAPMMQDPASPMTMIEEQGFKGIRMNDPNQGIITVAHGLGKLVFAVGSEDVASRIFSSLSNLPTGENALQNDPELREYLAENSIKPAMVFSYSRGEQVLKNLVPVMKSLSSSMKSASNEGAAELMEEFLELVPEESELEGLLGITFTRMFLNESGLVIEGSNEYK